MATAEGRITNLGSVAKKAAAIAGAAWGALKIGEVVSESVQAAVDFESSMADVAKVVDGLRDENGNLTDSYYAMSDSIIQMSKNIPMAAEELAAITASAGTAGIAMEELAVFTETAAKMGVAFDVTAEQAGDWMAKWRTSFSMTQEQVTALADQINYLSNNSASTASEISTIVTAVGPLGDVAGISAAQIAALGSTMVGVGVQQDVAATAIKKMATVMVSGASATDKQAAVLKQLGLDATQMAVRMQTDAEGAILSFLEAVKRLPEAEQAAALKNYFGQEAVGALAPLLTNLEVLQQRFNMVGDAQLYAGSMEAEYAARAATSANNIQLYENRIAALKIQLGTYLLPILNTVLGVASDGLEWIGEKMTAAEGKFSAFTTAAQNIVNGLVTNGVPKIKSFVGQAVGLFNKVKPTLDTIATKAGEAFTFITTTVGNAVRGVANKIEEHKDIINKVGEIAQRVGTHLWNAFEAAKPAIEYVGGTLIPAAADGLMTLVDTVLNVILHIRDFKEEIIAAAAVYGAFKVGTAIQGIATAFGNAQVQLKLFTMSTKNANIAQAAMNGTLKLGEVIVALFTGQTTIAQLAQAAWGTVTKALTAAQTALNAVLTANPIGLIIAAIAAVIAIVVVLYKKCDWFRNGVNKILGAVVSAFKKLWEGIKKVWEKIMQSLQPLIDAISGAFQEGWELIQVIWDAVGPYFTAIWDGIKAVFSVVKDFFVARFKVAWEGVKLVWAVAVSYFKTIWENIKLVFSVVKEFFAGMFSAAWEAIKVVWNAVVGYFAAIWNTIKGIFSVVKSVLTGDFQGAWDGIKGIVSTWTGYFSGVWDGIKGVFSKVGSWFSNTFSAAWNAIKGIFNNWGSFFSGLIDKIKSAFSNVVSIMTTPIENAKNFIKSAFDKIKSFVNFKWELPKLKLPHISVTGGVAPFGIGGKGSLPKFSIQWYKDGGILSGAQIFGAMGGKLLGGGEAGKEAVLPLSELWKNMRSVMSGVLQSNNGGTLGTLIGTINDKLQSARMAGTNTMVNALNALLGGKDNPQPALAGGPGGPGYHIVFSPVYQFYGEAPSKDDLTDAARMSQAEFNAMMDEYLKDKGRKDF